MPKPKCNDDVINSAVKLKKGGANNQDIARAIGIGESTFYRWVNTPSNPKERELGEALKKCEADYKNALQGIIAKAAQERDWKAAAWLLERKYPDEFARPDVQFAKRAAKEAAAEAIDSVNGVIVKIAEAAHEA